MERYFPNNFLKLKSTEKKFLHNSYEEGGTTLAQLKQSRPTRSPHRRFAFHPRYPLPLQVLHRWCPVRLVVEVQGDERRTREVQTMDSVRGCVGGAALSPGIVAARLLCRCFVTDRKVACLVCAKPRPRSLGTFAIIRKNDRSTIKPASKGALLPLRPPFCTAREPGRQGKW